MTDDIDLTPEAVAKLDEKLASQIGDDVSVIFNHESLFKQSRMMIAALSARLAEVEAERAAITENTLRIYEKLAQAVEALRPFAHATITPTGEIVGMDRVFFENARATIAQIGEGHE